MRFLAALLLFVGLFTSHAEALAGGIGTSGDPYTSLSDAYRVPAAGRYFFNLGSGTFQADVDTSEGGGWVLVLQYVHQGGTNPALSILGAGSNLPVTSSAGLGTDESSDATRWGHAGNAAMSQFSGDIEMRWYGQTSNHSRIIHFYSSVGDSYVRTGTGDFNGIQSSFTALTGHTANIPASAASRYSNKGDYAFTQFPYYESGLRHWGIRGEGSDGSGANGTRWEVDDVPGGFSQDTIHRVWVRQFNPLIVTNTNDSGSGSLRQAMLTANADPAADTITFAIPSGGVQRITLSSRLPAITDAGVTIDGITQSGATCSSPTAGTPPNLLIEVDGAGGENLMFQINASDVTIRGLSVVNSLQQGIAAENTSNFTMECNFLGVRADGITAAGLGQRTGINEAVLLRNGSGFTVSNNVISGNASNTEDDGLRLRSLSNSIVTGNIIGLAADGTTLRANADRGLDARDLTNTVIGGTTAALRNIISGNGNIGVQVAGDSSTSSFIGNYVGTDITGLFDRGNTSDGLGLGPGGTGIRVGGTAAGSRNIFAGNGSGGLEIYANTTNVTILGNYIGLGSDGTTVIRNDVNSVLVRNATNVSLGDGTAAGRNVIIGAVNKEIRLELTNSNITINGNYIGTDASGNASPIVQSTDLLVVENVATLNILNNVFGRTGQETIEFWGSFTGTGITIQGNSIGVGADGTTALPGGRNNEGAIHFGNGYSAPDAVIGGTNPGEGNVIANRNSGGIYLESPVTATIAGNTVRDMAQWGIILTGDASGTIEQNSIYANGFDGIRLNLGASDVTILGNYIGMAADGSTVAGNSDEGIDISGGSNFTIGDGTPAGRNIISNNGDRGINVNSASNVTVLGNYVGLADDGTTPAGNGGEGVYAGGVTGLNIGDGSGGGNVISGNALNGFRADTSTNVTVLGNTFGLAQDGSTEVANRNGINIRSSSSSVQIGNATVAGRNVISGNLDHGIVVDGSGDVTVAGNYIGITADGSTAAANRANGIELINYSDVTIGGSAAGARNIISGNGFNGISSISNAGPLILANNYIGTDATGTMNVGNGNSGIRLNANATASHTIGSANTADSNIIAFNGDAGIVATNTTTNVSIIGNSIYANGGLGIDLEDNGVTFNDVNDGDSGSNDRLNFPVINSIVPGSGNTFTYDFNLDVPSHGPGYRVDFYKNSSADPTGHGEGETHLGFVEFNHGGGDLNFTGSLNGNAPVLATDIISATTTRRTASGYDITSEFSRNASAEITGQLTVVITGEVYDPGALGLYNVPQNDRLMTATVSNETNAATSADSIFLIIEVPEEAEFYNGDVDDAGPETDPVSFDGSNAPGLTFAYANDVRFSDATSSPAYADCSYTPAAGYDSNVRFICVNPKGTLPSGDPDPNFTLRFRQRIR